MNAIVLAVVVMLVLSVARIHVVISLFIGALVGGLAAGMPLMKVIEAYQNGLSNGANIALTYGLLGVFSVALSHSGLPQILADFLIRRASGSGSGAKLQVKYLLLSILLFAGLIAETVVPIHIAFIFMMIPSLLSVFNRLNIDRRMTACVISFGLVTGYMMFPLGFGSIYLNDILLKNINLSGLNTDGVNVMQAMAIPGLGMLAGVLIAIFFSYRKPRQYADKPVLAVEGEEVPKGSPYRTIVACIAVVVVFVTQLKTDDSMMMGALAGILIFMLSGVVRFRGGR